jgi:hypothetical protein
VDLNFFCLPSVSRKREGEAREGGRGREREAYEEKRENGGKREEEEKGIGKGFLARNRSQLRDRETEKGEKKRGRLLIPKWIGKIEREEER